MKFDGSILYAVSMMPHERVKEWRDVHGLEGHQPLVLRWNTLPKWKPGHIETVSAAIHDWCLAQGSARFVVGSAMSSDRLVGLWMLCAAIRSVLELGYQGFYSPRKVIEATEKWIRGEMSDEDCCDIADECLSNTHDDDAANKVSEAADVCAMIAGCTSEYIAEQDAKGAIHSAIEAKAYATLDARPFSLGVELGSIEMREVLGRSARAALEAAAVGYAGIHASSRVVDGMRTFDRLPSKRGPEHRDKPQNNEFRERQATPVSDTSDCPGGNKIAVRLDPTHHERCGLSSPGDQPQPAAQALTLEEVEARLLAPSRLFRPLEEQASTFRLLDVVELLTKDGKRDRAEQLVAEMQLAYGGRILGEESGEVLKVIKRHLDYHQPLDRDKLRSELGNVLFSLVFTARAAGISLEELAREEMRALEARFGGYWTPEKASAGRAGDSDE